MLALFPAVVALLAIALFAWFFKYLKSLEENGCECALDNRRIVLMFCIVVIILGRIAAIFTKLPTGLELVVGLFGLTFIVTTIWYVSYLRKVKCECSENSARTVMEYYSWIVILLIPITIILIAPLVSMLVMYSMTNKMRSGVRPRSLRRAK